jgi:integrase
MTATALRVVPAERPVERPWEAMLRDAIRPEFRVEVYHPEPGDPVLYGPTCAIVGCPGRGVNRSLGLKAKGVNHSIGTVFRGYLCLAHVAMWRRDGEPPIDAWVRHCARALKTQAVPERCAVADCPRSTIRRGMCQAHHHRWQRAGEPDIAEFVPTATRVPSGDARCQVDRCAFPGFGTHGLCDGHLMRFRNVRASRPGMTVEGFLTHLAESRRIAAPRYDMRTIAPVMRLELALALQCRFDQRRGGLQPITFADVTRWLLDECAVSVLDHGEAHWKASAERRFPAAKRRTHPLAWLHFVRQCALRLREEHSGEHLWRWDTWPVERIDVDGRWAHQTTRRIYFSDIEPGWLRELAKRWARWRLTSATKSPTGVALSTSSIRRFCRWAETHDIALSSAAAITHGVLEDYRADVFTLDCAPGRKSGLLTDLKVFLDDVRLHEWTLGLAANATYYRGEIPHRRSALPRFIDEFVMGQLEDQRNLDRLPDLTTQTAVVILIETGLRSVDCLRLAFDPVTVDEAGAPYLRFFNHKLTREAIIPISQQLLEQIRRQQQDLTERFPARPPILLPRPRANPDGTLAFQWSALNQRLRRWAVECDIRDATGQPVRVTAHQFRHTVGTRMINNEVPLETVQYMLDHASPEMTVRYATVKRETLRREWERYQERINVRGEIVRLDPDGPLGDAAWAKENLARAKQTLPNGYCGLPLQQQCPHPNACLTCDNFLTTAEFLPTHVEQLKRTRQLQADARERGNERIVEMNEPVRLNLVRIIDGLQALTDELTEEHPDG